MRRSRLALGCPWITRISSKMQQVKLVGDTWICTIIIIFSSVSSILQGRLGRRCARFVASPFINFHLWAASHYANNLSCGWRCSVLGTGSARRLESVVMSPSYKGRFSTRGRSRHELKLGFTHRGNQSGECPIDLVVLCQIPQQSIARPPDLVVSQC